MVLFLINHLKERHREPWNDDGRCRYSSSSCHRRRGPDRGLYLGVQKQDAGL